MSVDRGRLWVHFALKYRRRCLFAFGHAYSLLRRLFQLARGSPGRADFSHGPGGPAMAWRSDCFRETFGESPVTECAALTSLIPSHWINQNTGASEDVKP